MIITLHVKDQINISWKILPQGLDHRDLLETLMAQFHPRNIHVHSLTIDVK